MAFLWFWSHCTHTCVLIGLLIRCVVAEYVTEILQYTCEQICQASTDLSLSVSRMVSSCFAVLRQIRGIRRSVSQYTPHLAQKLCRVADMDCRRRLRSASTLELHVPLTCRVTVGDRAFAVSAARVWNGRVCHLTLSRRHCWSPLNDGSRHCSSAARLISDSSYPAWHSRWFYFFLL